MTSEKLTGEGPETVDEGKGEGETARGAEDLDGDGLGEGRRDEGEGDWEGIAEVEEEGGSGLEGDGMETDGAKGEEAGDTEEEAEGEGLGFPARDEGVGWASVATKSMHKARVTKVKKKDIIEIMKDG